MKNTKRKEHLIIIGNGMAGVACVEEILKSDPERYEITIFGAEKHLNYNRVLLAHVLTGEKTLQDISLHDMNWYQENNIRLQTGSKVVEIRRRSRVVITEDGLETGYDRLILATGARPVLLSVPGIYKKGVVTFRDIDDCERIREFVRKGNRAVVIGGGLLGLEAAHALLKLGMKVTVVHIMKRLMERQLDDTAASFLKQDMEKLGIEILLNKETVEIMGEGNVEGLLFKDGSSIPAEVVVMSAGIKPNADLAKSSGIYCEKGVVVSDTMQTYDPAIYAVGECVQHRGATFGLVGPIFEQARVLANHLAGDCRLIFKNQATSSRLKVYGIDLYSAGTVDEDAGVETIEYNDKGSKRYKRLFLRNNRIQGIVMYGDTGDGHRLFSSLLKGEDLSDKRHNILFGDSVAVKEAASIEAMPDEAIVCGCNGRTKKMIVDAIEKKGLFTREDVKRETKASGSCGGCASLVDQILEATLGANFEGAAQQAGICGCTKYSRDDIIKNLKEKKLRSVSEVMETLGWETVGCDICRPAINYYAAMTWPKDYKEDSTSRLVNERVHANIQKDGTFSVVPRMYGGAANPEELKKIANVAIKYNVPLVKLTGGQRIALIGVKKDDLPKIWKDLAMPSGYAYGKALRTVKTCVGSIFCRYGTQDSLNLGIELEKKFEGLWMPAKLKMSVSGCPRNCSESGIKDIGIVGISGGWEILAGGCGGIELKGAEKLCTVKTTQEIMEITSAFIQYYREDAHYGERTFKWIRRVGFNTVRKAVVNDIDNRRRLGLRIEEASSIITDPWRERITAAVAC
jgi:nitrite reductase (NADH) large subunit